MYLRFDQTEVKNGKLQNAGIFLIPFKIFIQLSAGQTRKFAQKSNLSGGR